VRIRARVAYDGSAFSGWARQPSRDTVAGRVEAALGMALRLPGPVPTVCAGRTDAGVHARDQHFHADVPVAAWRQHGERVQLRLNGILPGSVRVLAVEPAPAGFDARFSVRTRTYRYRVSDRTEVDPLVRGHVLRWKRVLDLSAMNDAASGLLGEHDFASYCRAREGASSVRTLGRLDWRRDDDLLAVMTITADAFCHSMVRAVVGVLLAVGDGRRPVSWPAEVLAARRRTPAVTVAPGFPLVLEKVHYADDLAAAADRARRYRGTAGDGSAVGPVPPDDMAGPAHG
jgi:tRNA pseudouridine38-40 synthase